MIISRYLIKEILTTLIATTAILVLIFFSTQFIRYLTAAAGGRFASQLLMHVMVLQIPMLLSLLIPAGLYLAILLAYGRLYADREMVVLMSSGLSQGKLIAITMKLAIPVMIVVALLSLWLAPIVTAKQKMLVAEARSAPIIETILPGRFFSIDDGTKVFYLEQISRDRQQMKNLFIAENKPSSNDPKRSEWSIMVAGKGYQTNNTRGEHFVVIDNGLRYQGQPGEKDFQIIKFGKYYLQLTGGVKNLQLNEQTQPTNVLWHKKTEHPVMAELQWRISSPISVLILTLLAISLSKVSPRQGRFIQLLPAVLIYIVYANAMFLVRSWLQVDFIPAWLGVWWLHGLLLLTALILLARQNGWWQRLLTFKMA
jgi:lipopolysaccharide export system permease protein